MFYKFSAAVRSNIKNTNPVSCLLDVRLYGVICRAFYKIVWYTYVAALMYTLRRRDAIIKKTCVRGLYNNIKIYHYIIPIMFTLYTNNRFD